VARHLGRIAPAIALLLLLVPLWKGVELAESALRAKRDADTALAVARQLQERPTDAATLAAAPPALRAMTQSFGALHARLEPLQPLLDLTRGLPPQASWPADVPDALVVAAALADAGATMVAPLAAAPPAEQAGQGNVTRYLVAATTLAPAMPAVVSRVEAAEPALNRLHGRPLGGPLQPLGPIVDRLVEFMPEVRRAPELLQVLGPTVGLDRPRTYMLLGQNREEVRASGGFIGTAGSFTLDKGALTNFEYGSSYLVDEDVAPPPAPPPMVRHLGLGGWYLRDANWWPDFPATAAQVEQAWQRAGRPPVDGVIAIDNTVVESLLRALGPLDVPGFGTVNAENFEQLSVETLYDPADHLRPAGFHGVTAAFFGTFGRTFVARLLALSPAELAPVAKGLVELLDSKHIQLAFKDPELAALASARAWDGAVPPLSADSLYVVDTTVSYGKTYRFVRTQGSLSVDLGEHGHTTHELTLEYRNVYPDGLLPWMPTEMVGGDTFDLASGQLVEAPGFWGNWLRVYLPPGARGVSVEGLTEQGPPQAEFGRTVVAGYLPLAPGQRRTVQVRYVTDGQAQESTATYRVFLQKQAGLDCRPLSLLVRWPHGASAQADACPRGDRWIELTAAAASDPGAPSARAS